MGSADHPADVLRVRALAHEVIERCDPRTTPQAEVLGAWFDAGLTWVHFPIGRGGLGLSPGLQQGVDDLLISAGGAFPRLANDFVAPTLVEHAHPDIVARLLRRAATAEDIWCQLLSEPGAGSDLAGLATSAKRDGDAWIVNGQKVWSSNAHKASWGILLARTDPNVPKHKGLTYFVVDMHSPGVDVRPLRQMTGRAEFNEVFLTNVVIPDNQRIGPIGGGWKVARTTLTNERMSVGDGGDELPPSIMDALKLWGERADTTSPVQRDELARLWARAQAHQLTCDRFAAQRAGGSPGHESAIAKLVGGELNQAAYEFCGSVLGIEATRYGSYDMDAPEGGMQGEAVLQQRLLRCRANTLAGGTSEVLRNIISERMLSLPEEHRVDRDIPWRDVRRG